MDLNCISQANVCRCCLSTCGNYDLTMFYVSEENQEVFSDILQECLGIKLSHITEYEASHMVCETCVGQLRVAQNFRRQVLQAERCFVSYWVNKVSPEEIKPEQKLYESVSSYTFDHVGTARDDDSDSDTPIAELAKKNVISGEHNRIYKTLAGESKDRVSKGIYTGQNKSYHTFTKQISERKRIMQSCDIILKYTTACPFRHHKSWFQCFFCQQTFMEINILRQHTLDTHSNIDEELKKLKRYPRSLQIEISNLKCRECDLNFTEINSMCSHFSDCHEKVIYKECIADYKVNTSPYSCHLCGQQFHVFRTLTTHLNEHYANCICDVCGKSFLNSKRFKVHKRTHEKGQFSCSQCGKMLKTKTSLTNHIESNHSRRILKCQICFAQMKHYNDRIKHMSEVHNITHKFKCPICSKEYNIKHYLATHMRQTHGHKNKKCEECGMVFITNYGLKKHMFKHTGVKPFTCSICSKSYARSYTLKEHIKSHHDEKKLSDNSPKENVVLRFSN